MTLELHRHRVVTGKLALQIEQDLGHRHASAAHFELPLDQIIAIHQCLNPIADIFPLLNRLVDSPNHILELAGQQVDRLVDFPGVLVTQDFLVSNAIKNMVDLRAAMPELNLSSVQSADWIPSIEF